MNRYPLVLGLTFVMLMSSLSANAIANPVTRQVGGGCPTYQTNLVIDFVDSTPHNPTVGETVVTRIHVVYPDGTPVTILPQTMSFLWNGTASSKEFDNVEVIPTGSPGWYNYTQELTQDLANTLGFGTVTIYILPCSCQDTLGNRGPTEQLSSFQTLTPSDLSTVQLGTQTTTTGGGVPATYVVPLAIAFLLIIALLLFLLRARRKKPKT